MSRYTPMAAKDHAVRARILFYGDDFTGASDNTAQYARHGLRTMLFFARPDWKALQQAVQTCDVVGVAGNARSLNTSDMNEELLPLLQDFQALQVPLVQYKCCSTFDSSPATGSLGHAIALMRQVWPDCFVPVHSAAPEFGRYTVFGHHFARSGSDIHRLDRHPVMSVHPVTPIHESGLVEVLRAQGFRPELSVDLRKLDQHQSTPESLADGLNADGGSAVFDSYTQQHVVTAAAAIWRLSQQRQVCAMAAQGLAHGLGQYLRESGLIEDAAPVQQLPATDSLLVLSGSCSAVSAAQIAHARHCGFVCLRLGSDILLQQDEAAFERVQSEMLRAIQTGQSVVIFSAEGPHDAQSSQVREQTRDWPPGKMAQRIGQCFAQLADRAFRETPLSRLVVAGGDSSSFTMRSLGAHALQVKASHFAQNAHFASLVSDDPQIHGKEVLLKGGQVGTDDLYPFVLAGFGPA